MYRLYIDGCKNYFATRVNGEEIIVRFFPNSETSSRGRAIICNDVKLKDSCFQRFVPDEEVSIDVRVEVLTTAYGISWIDDLDELIEDDPALTTEVAARCSAPLDYVELTSRKVSSFAPGVGTCIVISTYSISYEIKHKSKEDVVTVVSIEGDGDDDVWSAVSIESISGNFDESFEEMDIEAENADDDDEGFAEADIDDLGDELDHYEDDEEDPDSDNPDGDGDMVTFDGI